MSEVLDDLEVMTPSVFRVAIENVSAIWQEVEPLVQKALRTEPTHDVDDVRSAILSNQANLWVQRSDHIEGVVVTEFVSYPRGLALRVWLAGARDEDRGAHALFQARLYQWAKMNRCKWIEAVGRAGWLRRVPGFTYSGVVMRMVVDWRVP